jgi:hypothetical protein
MKKFSPSFGEVKRLVQPEDIIERLHGVSNCLLALVPNAQDKRATKLRNDALVLLSEVEELLAKLLGQTPPKRSHLIAASAPEYGDARDVRRIFGIKESMTYSLTKAGKIKSVLVTHLDHSHGKRLYDFASIRRLLSTPRKEVPFRGGMQIKRQK